MEIIRIEGYSFTYPGASEPAVRDAFLHVEEGAFCVLAGSTGCGKTTLLKALKPELAPVGTCRGEVQICGVPLVEEGRLCNVLDARESASCIGFVMQDPAAQIVCDTVWHELAFGLENLGVPQDEMRRRVAEVAHFFGIEPWVRAETETLSGGQKQLVNLAAVLALRPRVLVLDEPTAQLDPHAVKQFLFMLARVNRELGITVVMATHALEDVELYATQWLHMGDIGSVATREEAAAVLAPRLDARMDACLAVRTAAQGSAGGVRESGGAGGAGEAKKAAGILGGAWRSARRNAADAVLDLCDVHFRYERTQPWVLRGVSLQVACGSVHALVGGNGCGKSTLLRLMAGVHTPQRGKISHVLRDSQALVPQDPKALFVCDTVAEELHEWQHRCGYAEEDVARIMARFGLAAHAAQHPYDLSGGQQQKLAFAKVLLAKPQMLFLDEPTKGLDPVACAEVSGIVRSLADEGVSVVLVTHDLDFAFITADEVTMLFDGQVAATEGVREFFANNLVYRPNAASRLFGQVVAHA